MTERPRYFVTIEIYQFVREQQQLAEREAEALRSAIMELAAECEDQADRYDAGGMYRSIAKRLRALLSPAQSDGAGSDES
jgi:hypothetical protein